MIQHIVMLRLARDYEASELDAIMAGLQALQLPGLTGFAHGPNRDFEHRSTDYPYGFICTFTDEDALRIYAADPTHQVLGARLVALCGGSDGIMVIDLAI